MSRIFNASRNWFFKLAVPSADHVGSVSSEQKKFENIGKSIIIRIKHNNIFKKREEYIRYLVKFIQLNLCMVPLEWFSKSELDSIVFLSLCFTYSSIIFNLQLSLFVEVIQENMNQANIAFIQQIIMNSKAQAKVINGKMNQVRSWGKNKQGTNKGKLFRTMVVKNNVLMDLFYMKE